MAQRKIFGDGPCLQAELSFKTLLGREARHRNPGIKVKLRMEPTAGAPLTRRLTWVNTHLHINVRIRVLPSLRTSRCSVTRRGGQMGRDLSDSLQ